MHTQTWRARHGGALTSLPHATGAWQGLGEPNRSPCSSRRVSRHQQPDIVLKHTTGYLGAAAALSQSSQASPQMPQAAQQHGIPPSQLDPTAASALLDAHLLGPGPRGERGTSPLHLSWPSVEEWLAAYGGALQPGALAPVVLRLASAAAASATAALGKESPKQHAQQQQKQQGEQPRAQEVRQEGAGQHMPDEGAAPPALRFHARLLPHLLAALQQQGEGGGTSEGEPGGVQPHLPARTSGSLSSGPGSGRSPGSGQARGAGYRSGRSSGSSRRLLQELQMEHDDQQLHPLPTSGGDQPGAHAEAGPAAAGSSALSSPSGTEPGSGRLGSRGEAGPGPAAAAQRVLSQLARLAVSSQEALTQQQRATTAWGLVVLAACTQAPGAERRAGLAEPLQGAVCALLAGVVPCQAPSPSGQQEGNEWGHTGRLGPAAVAAALLAASLAPAAPGGGGGSGSWSNSHIDSISSSSSSLDSWWSGMLDAAAGGAASSPAPLVAAVLWAHAHAWAGNIGTGAKGRRRSGWVVHVAHLVR